MARQSETGQIAMERAAIAGTSLEVSRVALGTWAIGGWMWGGTDEAESIATIRAALDREVFQPAVAAAKSQDDIVRMLFILEDVMAQLYVYAAPTAMKPEHRVTLMTVGGVQARHRVVLGSVFAHQSLDDLLPSPFAAHDNPLPADAILS